MDGGANAGSVRRPRWSDRAKRVLLPPAGLFWTFFLGAALARATPYSVLGWSLAGASVAALYALSTPLARRLLMATLDRFEPLPYDRIEDTGAAAIVVLDSGRKLGAREYGGAAVREATLERLVYAGWLHRKLGTPILVSGNGSREMMADLLRESLGVPTRWIEPRSHNTHESAVESAKLLRAEGVVRILLVTHFWHMPRAVAAFSAAGLEVVPAPMGFGSLLYARPFLGLLPHPQAMAESYLAVHEWAGMAWYRLRYRHVRP